MRRSAGERREPTRLESADGGYSRPVWADRRSTKPAYEDRPDPAVNPSGTAIRQDCSSFCRCFAKYMFHMLEIRFYRGEMLSVGSCREHVISACHSRQITLVHALNLAQ